MGRFSTACTCFLLFAPFLTACGSDADASSDWQGTLRDSAGVVLVENRDSPMWVEGETWSFTKVARIGLADGDPRYQFGGLSGLVVLSDGRIVIADMLYHNVRFFSPDGEYLFELGKKGSGPEEFAGFIELYVGPGDTILAWDRRTQRASRIGPDGAWLGSFSTTPQDGYFTWAWDDDGTSGEIVSFQRPMTGEAAPDDDRFSLVIRRDLRGAFLDTLARLPAQRFITGTGDARLRHFYRGVGYYDVCGGMLVTGHSDEFRFVWQRPDGTTARIGTLDREKTPMTSEDRRLFFRSLEADFAEDGRTGQLAAIKSRVRFEETYPAWRRFVCGPDGAILVQRNLPVSETYPEVNTGASRPIGGSWDAFDNKGRYLGVAPLPAEPHRHAFTQLASGDWLMLGIEEDEMDVQFVGIWKVEGIDTE